MALPDVFNPRINRSPQISPDQKQVFGLYSSDTSSSLGVDNSVAPVRVDQKGRLLTSPVIVPTNNPTYLGQVVTASLAGASIDTSAVWGLDATFIFNVGPEGGSLLTGSVALQKNNDGTNWLDVTRTAVAVGPGNTVQSGSFFGSAYAENARLQFSYLTGSGSPSVTASYTTKQ